MRLTCPNCAAAYEVAPELIPARGGHVQCTACHTRWFMRGGLQALGSEEQIIRRLEARRPGPRAVPEQAAARSADVDKDFVWESKTDPEPPAPAADAPAAASDAGAETDAPADPAAPAFPTGTVEDPTAPASPAIAAAEPAAPAPEPAPSAVASSEAPPSASVSSEAAPAAAAPTDSTRGEGNRFGLGLLCALALCAVAVGIYLGAIRLADAVPGAAPLIDGYASAIDDVREGIAGRSGRSR